MSQAAVAKKVGLSAGMISHYLNGRHVPTWKTAEKLAKKFGRKPEWWIRASREQMEKQFGLQD